MRGTQLAHSGGFMAREATVIQPGVQCVVRGRVRAARRRLGIAPPTHAAALLHRKIRSGLTSVKPNVCAHWERFEHEADMGIRIYQIRPLTCQRSQSVIPLTGCKIGFE